MASAKNNDSEVHTHPGLPFPHGLSQLGSPGFDAFHRAKSLHHFEVRISLLEWILVFEGMLEEQMMGSLSFKASSESKKERRGMVKSENVLTPLIVFPTLFLSTNLLLPL